MITYSTFLLFQGQWCPVSVDEISCVELDDHNKTCSSICTSFTESSRSRGSISSNTASVLSLNSISPSLRIVPFIQTVILLEFFLPYLNEAVLLKLQKKSNRIITTSSSIVRFLHFPFLLLTYRRIQKKINFCRRKCSIIFFFSI